MGIFDSSLTRVQPVFNSLYAKDPTGKSWVKAFLQLGSLSDQIKFSDIIQLRQAPVFELSADPPRSFLKWLISNPGRLSSPSASYLGQRSANTREKRKAILGGNFKTQSEAIQEIESCKKLPSRRWWRLEGVTQVDCALLAEDTVIFIEGKRTELGASRNIVWYQYRNQVLRNLDCVAEYARQHGLKNFYMIMVVEKRLTENDTVRQEEIRQITLRDTIDKSLPHLSNEQREYLMTHFLGVTTWEDIVEEFGLGSGVLIDRVDENTITV